MPIISNQAKNELIQLSLSKDLKSDFQHKKKRKYNAGSMGNADNIEYSLDEFIKFNSIMASFSNHCPKMFKKMDGDNFKL